MNCLTAQSSKMLKSTKDSTWQKRTHPASDAYTKVTKVWTALMTWQDAPNVVNHDTTPHFIGKLISPNDS